MANETQILATLAEHLRVAAEAFEAPEGQWQAKAMLALSMRMGEALAREAIIVRTKGEML